MCMGTTLDCLAVRPRTLAAIMLSNLAEGDAIMRRSFKHALQFVLCVSLASVSGCGTPSQEDRQTLNQQAQTTLNELYQRIPASKGISDKARATLAFPSVTEAGFIVGGGYGRGVLFERGKPVAYYSAGGASLGLQIGAQSHREVYFFTTEQAYNDFKKSSGFEFGAGVDFAVADVSATGDISTTTLNKPIIVFVWGEQGLMAGVSIQGRVVTKLED